MIYDTLMNNTSTIGLLVVHFDDVLVPLTQATVSEVNYMTYKIVVWGKGNNTVPVVSTEITVRKSFLGLVPDVDQMRSGRRFSFYDNGTPSIFDRLTGDLYNEAWYDKEDCSELRLRILALVEALNYLNTIADVE